MTTDGGPHSPEKMATACAGAIVNIDPSKIDGARLIAAQRLEFAIVEALVKHTSDAQTETRSSLANDPAAHFARSDLNDPGQRLDEAMNDVQAVADGTEWGEQFREPDKAAAIRQVIGQYLVDISHIERLWHADRNPSDTMAVAYKTGV